MFSRATITLGIGPHSSFFSFQLAQTRLITGREKVSKVFKSVVQQPTLMASAHDYANGAQTAKHSSPTLNFSL